MEQFRGITKDGWNKWLNQASEAFLQQKHGTSILYANGKASSSQNRDRHSGKAHVRAGLMQRKKKTHLSYGLSNLHLSFLKVICRRVITHSLVGEEEICSQVFTLYQSN
jgi:hypothetical protein